MLNKLKSARANTEWYNVYEGMKCADPDFKHSEATNNHSRKVLDISLSKLNNAPVYDSRTDPVSARPELPRPRPFTTNPLSNQRFILEDSKGRSNESNIRHTLPGPDEPQPLSEQDHTRLFCEGLERTIKQKETESNIADCNPQWHCFCRTLRHCKTGRLKEQYPAGPRKLAADAPLLANPQDYRLNKKHASKNLYVVQDEYVRINDFHYRKPSKQKEDEVDDSESDESFGTALAKWRAKAANDSDLALVRDWRGWTEHKGGESVSEPTVPTSRTSARSRKRKADNEVEKRAANAMPAPKQQKTSHSRKRLPSSKRGSNEFIPGSVSGVPQQQRDVSAEAPMSNTVADHVEPDLVVVASQQTRYAIPADLSQRRPWMTEYQEGHLSELGLTKGAYHGDATQIPSDKQSRPGNAGGNAAGSLPSVNWVIWTLLARVPGGRMSFNVIWETGLEWIPGMKDTKNQTWRRMLSVHDAFRWTDDSCWRLANIGEPKQKKKPGGVQRKDKSKGEDEQQMIAPEASLGSTTPPQLTEPASPLYDRSLSPSRQFTPINGSPSAEPASRSPPPSS